MKVDNPQAFRFIMQDEIYLLDKDKATLSTPEVPAAYVAPAEEPQPSQAQVNTTIKEQDTPASIPAEQSPSTPAVSIETPPDEFNYLGKNNKNFVVLVNYADHEHIAPPHLAALENILKRKELSLNDVAILNVNKYAPVKLTRLAAYFNPAQLVIIGADALPEGIGNLPLNRPLQGKKTHVLYSFSFDEMMSSNDNKKIFWEHMKTL